MTESYGYAAGNPEIANSTTNLVSELTLRDSAGSLLQGYGYTYDALGNVTRQSDTKSGGYTDYTYDSQGQLLTAKRYASGGALQGAAAYTYDTVGNLLTATDGTTTHTYTYGDAQWRDLLTAYDGGAISYDAIGNPLRYYDGTAFQWTDGRRLASRTKNGQTTAYAYNEDGLRTRKTNPDGSYSDYYWVGTQLLAEVQHQADGAESRILKFCYDEKNSPIGFVLTSGGAAACYYFGKNLQGDVIGLYRWNWSEDYHHTMTLVATYDYDPWGKLLSITDPTGAEITSASDPANLNPLRYRGYYQDNDTGFYYLQSRYYDPELKRFINADSYSSTGQGFLGHNMFAYCGNSPISGVDWDGNAWNWTNFWTGVGATIVATATVAVVVASGGLATPLAVTAVSATFVTGGVITGAAATETTAVVDLSLTVPLIPGTYFKSGGSLVMDFGEGTFEAYPHIGFGVGFGCGPTLSSGIVNNYSGPNSYGGEFVDLNGAYYFGGDYCYDPDPDKSNSERVSAASCTFSAGISAGIGYDYYFPATNSPAPTPTTVTKSRGSSRTNQRRRNANYRKAMRYRPIL